MPLAHRWIRIAAIAATLTLAGCQTAPPVAPQAQLTHTIYVVRRSWHIDIGFEALDLAPPLAQVRGAYPSALYLEFGFGDRHYLMSQHHGAGNMLAALWPGAGLVLMTALKASPAQAFGTANVLELRVTAQQSQAVQQFIWHSLQVEHDRIAPLASGPYEGSLFYAAGATYSAFHTCNTWAAEALHSAQLPVRSTGVEFAGQLWAQAQRLREAQLSDRDP